MAIRKITSNKTYTRPQPKKKYTGRRAVDLSLGPKKTPTQAQEMGTKKANPIHPYTGKKIQKYDYKSLQSSISPFGVLAGSKRKPKFK